MPSQHTGVRSAQAGRRDTGHGSEHRLVFSIEGAATGLIHQLHGAEGRAA